MISPSKSESESDELREPFASDLSPISLASLAAIYTIGGNISRLTMLDYMSRAETRTDQPAPSVADLAMITGLSTSSTSQHLAGMRAAGLVEHVRDNQFHRYRLTSDHGMRALAEYLIAPLAK